MAKKKKTRVVYRDSKTGHLVSKAKWKRSKSHGGTRYKRRIERVSKRRYDIDAIEELREIEREERREETREAVTAVKKERATGQRYEWVNAFKYERTGKSFDVITVATNLTDAFSVAKQFLQDDPEGQRIIRSNFRGWKHITAIGRKTNEPLGSAEYRAESSLL